MSIKRIINDGSLRNTIGDKVNQTDPRLSDQRTPSDNSVTSAKIVDGAIVNADVNNSAAIAQSKIANLTADLGSKADYAMPANAQSGTTYTFALADATRLTTATSASAKTFTIPPQSAVTWAANSIIRVVNYGAGALTVNGGSGVTVTNAAKTLAQFESAALIRTGSNAWTLAPFLGGGASIPSSVGYLVIAGGGGGGNFVAGVSNGGGGGAGGYRCSVSGETSGRGSSAESPMTPTNGVTYTITVGGGGGANAVGANSSISGTGLTTITSNGGGLGTGNGNGGTGGAGGGAATNGTGGAGTANQGYDGGSGGFGDFAGGGGGGAGSNPSVRNGGNGLSSAISGSSVTRGGGGGGGGSTVAGVGGTGGGGNAGLSGGAANTGGGGGGGSGGGGGFAGGSGVVILRQARSNSNILAAVSGGTTTINSTHIIYTFNGSGSISWSA